MRKRTPLIGLGVIVGLWLVPAAFVSLYEPAVPREPHRAEAPDPVDDLLAPREPQFFLLAHGYTKHWAVESWEGDEATADKSREEYYVERGPLDRRAGTFRLTLSCEMNDARDLEGVRLFVTSEEYWSGDDEAIWTRVAEALVKNPGADEAALLCDAAVPASTTAYRLVEVHNGVERYAFSQSILTAPTALGRVYDAIAWLPLFNWVPDLR